MPLYAYECARGHQSEEMRSIDNHDLPGICDFCKGVTQQVIVGASPHLFPSGVWDDLDVVPLEIGSKKQLERECRKRGVIARNYMEHYGPAERLIKWGPSERS